MTAEGKICVDETVSTSVEVASSARSTGTLGRWSRRSVVGMTAALVSAPTVLRAGTPTLRVGYQKYGSLLLLKASGLLEQRLKPLGTRVEWKEFIAGPALMEALGAGAIDVGTVGETPPIFAQAAGAPLVYLSSEPSAPKGEAILVRDKSPIHSLADLRGKKVAFNQGSNVHYLFVKAIAAAGLSAGDVKPIYLSPADGRAAFERGSVDAWVIWDPFLAAAQAAGGTRMLADATGLATNHQFYVGSRRFKEADVLRVFQEAIVAIDAQTTVKPTAAAKKLSSEIGLPEAVLATALARQAWNVQPMDAKLIADQQAIADTFFKLGLIPKTIKIADALP